MCDRCFAVLSFCTILWATKVSPDPSSRISELKKFWKGHSLGVAITAPAATKYVTFLTSQRIILNTSRVQIRLFYHVLSDHNVTDRWFHHLICVEQDQHRPSDHHPCLELRSLELRGLELRDQVEFFLLLWVFRASRVCGSGEEFPSSLCQVRNSYCDGDTLVTWLLSWDARW